VAAAYWRDPWRSELRKVPEPAMHPQWLRRHHLLWTSPVWRAAAIEQIVDATVHAQVAAHLAAGWPLVVCRQSSAGNKDCPAAYSVSAGLPLPPDLGKRRLALTVPASVIVRVAPPLDLKTAISRLPPDWQPPLRRLLHSANDANVELRVYGSVAWHALTRRPWLTARSDVDFLWRARDSAQIAAGVKLLYEWERQSGRRADGEILLGDDDAIAWREWAPADGRRPSRRIIVKSLYGPRLCARGDLEARLALGSKAVAACA